MHFDLNIKQFNIKYLFIVRNEKNIVEVCNRKQKYTLYYTFIKKHYRIIWKQIDMLDKTN